jgi:TonB-dependent SusC/RagA subfamily outer membrane receptor
MKKTSLLLPILFCLCTLMAHSQTVKQDSIEVKSDEENKKIVFVHKATNTSVTLDSRGSNDFHLGTKTHQSKIDKTPLIIVDGKEIAENEMNLMNPNDIESMSVYKDEKAIAEYGSKGKNGVILITLKKKK